MKSEDASPYVVSTSPRTVSRSSADSLFVQHPGHYSQQGDSYHRRSFGAATSPFTMTSNNTERDGKHAKDNSNSSDFDFGHGRGPTAYGLEGMRTASAAAAAQPSQLAQRRDGKNTLPNLSGDKQLRSNEEIRLEEDDRKERHWRRWGPYVSERQWVSSGSKASYVHEVDKLNACRSSP